MRVKSKTNSGTFIGLLIFFLFSFALTRVGIADYLPEVMVVLWIIAAMIFLYVLFGKNLKSSNERILFWLSFFAKIGYAIYRFGFSDFANPTLTADAERFWRVATQYYAGNYSTTYTTYPYILNAQFQLFGVNGLCCIILNIAFSMAMVGIVLKIFDRLEISGNARLFGSIFACFMPYAFHLSTSMLREPMYFCFIALSFLFYVSYIFDGKQAGIYMALLSLIPVLILHIGYFPIAVVYFWDLIRNDKMRTAKDLLYKIVLIGAFIVFVAVSSSFNSTEEYLTGSTGGIAGLINRLTSDGVSETTANAGSLYLPGVYITSVRTFLLYSPLKWLFYISGPLPMNWRGLPDVAAFFLDGFVHVVVLISGMKGISQLKRCYKERAEEMDGKMLRVMRAGLWAVVLCAFVFGLGTRTAGTAIRHRDVLLGIEVIIFALSLMIKRKHQNDLAKTWHTEK